MAATTSTHTLTPVARLLGQSRYEVIPLAGVEEKVLEHVHRDVTITVTASPIKGLEPTLELSTSLASHGYSVVPHLSARLVRDRSHLSELIAQFDGLGITDVFVVGGDADAPAGEFEGAPALLEAMHEIGHPFEQIGITGYPESHPLIDDWTTIASMFEKARYATYIASQICFDSRITVAWINNGANVHTVSALDGSFESGSIPPGKAFVYTFTKPGTYQFLCRQHFLNGMSGSITVQ